MLDNRSSAPSEPRTDGILSRFSGNLSLPADAGHDGRSDRYRRRRLTVASTTAPALALRPANRADRNERDTAVLDRTGTTVRIARRRERTKNTASRMPVLTATRGRSPTACGQVRLTERRKRGRGEARPRRRRVRSRVASAMAGGRWSQTCGCKPRCRRALASAATHNRRRDIPGRTLRSGTTADSSSQTRREQHDHVLIVQFVHLLDVRHARHLQTARRQSRCRPVP